VEDLALNDSFGLVIANEFFAVGDTVLTRGIAGIWCDPRFCDPPEPCPPGEPLCGFVPVLIPWPGCEVCTKVNWLEPDPVPGFLIGGQAYDSANAVFKPVVWQADSLSDQLEFMPTPLSTLGGPDGAGSVLGGFRGGSQLIGLVGWSHDAGDARQAVVWRPSITHLPPWDIEVLPVSNPQFPSEACCADVIDGTVFVGGWESDINGVPIPQVWRRTPSGPWVRMMIPLPPPAGGGAITCGFTIDEDAILPDTLLFGGRATYGDAPPFITTRGTVWQTADMGTTWTMTTVDTIPGFRNGEVHGLVSFTNELNFPTIGIAGTSFNDPVDLTGTYWEAQPSGDSLAVISTNALIDLLVDRPAGATPRRARTPPRRPMTPRSTASSSGRLAPSLHQNPPDYVGASGLLLTQSSQAESSPTRCQSQLS
jgi:hypothetical protein